MEEQGVTEQNQTAWLLLAAAAVACSISLFYVIQMLELPMSVESAVKVKLPYPAVAYLSEREKRGRGEAWLVHLCVVCAWESQTGVVAY